MSNYSLYVNDEIKAKLMALPDRKRNEINDRIRDIIKMAVQ